MNKMEWNDSLSVKIAEMDKQHKVLVQYLNDVIDLAEKSQTSGNVDLKGIATILNSLVQYTLTHFKDEEELMKKHNYPDFDKHKIIHEKLVSDVVALKGEFEAKGFSVVPKLTNFLVIWLKGHIQGIDKKYAEHINKKVA